MGGQGWPQPSTFEPRANPNIVTTQDVRAHARMEQEGREAAIHAQAIKAVAAAVENENPAANPLGKFGIVESAPEPPQDALDSFFDLKM